MRIPKLLFLAFMLYIVIASAADLSVLKSVALPRAKSDVKAIDAMIGNAKLVFSVNKYPDAVPQSVSERIFSGLQAAPRRLLLTNGVTIVWGEKFQEFFFFLLLSFMTQQAGHDCWQQVSIRRASLHLAVNCGQ